MANRITRLAHPRSSAVIRAHRLTCADPVDLSPEITNNRLWNEGLTMPKQNEQFQFPNTEKGLSIRQLRTWLGHCGMSVSGYDIEYVPMLQGLDGRPAYGVSPHDGRGRPLVGARGRPLIQLSGLAMRDVETAVVTLFHEIAHHRSFRAVGNGGTEAGAETYGRRMYNEFLRQWA